MSNHWALLIGINQYSAVQPLMYAQSDAIGMRNFFVDELGVPIAQCVLLTDMSAAIEPYAHYPTRIEIETQLKTLCQQQVKADDLLWVFFSGYGATEAGQDYWLPVDGDPERLGETAIALSWVFEILKTAPTQKIVLAIDMNHSQGAVGHHNIGQQTLELAKNFEIPTLLSCQPDQYAHETMFVRHGLFTKAMLEGMRYHGCVTVALLADYLKERLPELSQHHWRPIQSPAIVLPAIHKFMMIVPPDGVVNLPMTERASEDWHGNDAAPAGTDRAADLGSMPNPAAGTPARPAAPPSPPQSALVRVTKSTQPPGVALNNTALWVGGLIGVAVMLLGGVLLRFQPFGRDAQAPEPAPSAVAPAPAPEAGEAPSDSTEAMQPTPENLGAADPEPEPESGLFPSGLTPTAASATALERAEAAIAAGRYGEARAWLSQVPPEQQTRAYETLWQTANSEIAQAAEQNQAILNQARQIIQPVSASLFNDAIETARQIPPADPYYEQAQADIDRWSRIILDLAEGRAAVGDIGGAIAAARLVPRDRPAVYQLAQQRIAQWERQLINQQLVQQAQNSLQPGQASSYQEAILLLQRITPDQPGYQAAQDRITQWSEDILVIARARAAQGRMQEAIAAAQLVPAGTPAHEQAQAEIQRWQGQG